MTDFILQIACAATVLCRRDTWGAFDWNWSEYSLPEALEVLSEDIEELTDCVRYGRDAYFEANR